MHVFAELPDAFIERFAPGHLRGDILRCRSCGVLCWRENLTHLTHGKKTAYQYTHCGPVVWEEIIESDDDGTGFLGSEDLGDTEPTDPRTIVAACRVEGVPPDPVRHYQ